MKLEPVALSAHMTDAQIYAGLFECDALERVGYSEEMLQVVRRLIDSAIPEGYVVVPVEQAKNAELLTWIIEKHGEQIRQIMWSYKQCCGDEINALGVKALITAAKEQS